MADRMHVMKAMGFSPRRAYRGMLSQVVGINTSHPSGARVLNGWIQAAEKKVPFLEPSGDQLSFTALINEYGLLHCILPRTYYLSLGNEMVRPRNSPAILCHQYAINTPRQDFSQWSK